MDYETNYSHGLLKLRNSGNGTEYMHLWFFSNGLGRYSGFYIPTPISWSPGVLPGRWCLSRIAAYLVCEILVLSGGSWSLVPWNGEGKGMWVRQPEHLLQTPLGAILTKLFLDCICTAWKNYFGALPTLSQHQWYGYTPKGPVCRYSGLFITANWTPVSFSFYFNQFIFICDLY